MISYLQNSNHVEESEDKCFVCVMDNIVVGNIIKCKMNINNNLAPVILPDWQIFLKILQSPNHQFIERPIPVFPGTIWEGEEFIAPIEDVPVTQNGTTCKKVQNSYIYYENDILIAVKEYTMYIIELLEDYLNKNPLLCINVFVNTNSSIETNNENRIVKIGINYEQTIVSDESVTHSVEPQGKIEFSNKKYTVKMDLFPDLNQMDIVLDYSKPNIKNIEISGLYNDYLQKIKYISPSFYKSVSDSTNQKNTNIITLFTGEQPTLRRQNIITELSKLDKYTHRYDCYDKELVDLLIDSKILVNIHQNDYKTDGYESNTFEELRVLPALMNKVLVISETSPLTEIVPYSPLVIWATYETIVEKTKEVLENYDEYFNKIFTNENINLLNRLNNLNEITISQMLQ
jgi:hypothetical protein